MDTRHLKKLLDYIIDTRLSNESEEVKKAVAYYSIEEVEDTLSEVVENVIQVRLSDIKLKYELQKIQ